MALSTDPAAAAPGASDGRYTLKVELARGGMGRIWVADDARLARKVALKELLDSTAAHRVRFERELSLTSRLEHPSIVSIQDGGTWADGKPYYVMKLVNGESLDRVIARASTAERIALLPHGLAVVDALAYAHAQGIVHRDLKPENILIGDFGETVVIDWGLAKDLRAATPDLVEGPYRDVVRVGETLGGEVLGTPAYMPPEQALGDAVDERADVYALGAVLYHLLSGRRPHDGASTEEILANVISAPPPPLATRAPDLPADLVAIVDKAMARKPEDRYPNAGELAIDLKRFQGGQLVGAHRYTGSELLRRWLRKHRTAVIVGALAAVTLVTVGAVSFARIVREHHEADDARVLADHNRALADDRRAAAEGLVTFMLGDLRASLAPIGKLALLELPAQKALSYFDARHDLAPDERESRSVALENLGDALKARGDRAGAEARYREAIAEMRRLTAEGHTRVEWQYLDATLHTDLGDLLTLNGATIDAINEYRAAIAMFASLTTTRPSDKRGSRGQQQVLEKLAGVLVTGGQLASAQHEYRTALELASARVRATPDDLEAQVDMVAPEHAIGDALIAAGDAAGALAAYRATRERLEAVAKQAPQDMPVVRMLQLSSHRIGLALVAQHELAGALVAFREAAALSDRLVAQDPENQSWRYEQALNLARMAAALQASADTAGAIAEYHRSLSILRSLTSNSEVARNHVVIQAELSDLFADAKQWQLAEAEAREAVGVAEQRVKQEPNNRPTRFALSDGYASLGAALLELHRPVDALDVATRALDLARALVASAPDEPTAQRNLQQALVNVGTARCAARGHGDPHAAYDEALALDARHLAVTPTDASWHDLDEEARARAKACRP